MTTTHAPHGEDGFLPGHYLALVGMLDQAQTLVEELSSNVVPQWQQGRPEPTMVMITSHKTM